MSTILPRGFVGYSLRQEQIGDCEGTEIPIFFMHFTYSVLLLKSMLFFILLFPYDEPSCVFMLHGFQTLDY